MKAWIAIGVLVAGLAYASHNQKVDKPAPEQTQAQTINNTTLTPDMESVQWDEVASWVGDKKVPQDTNELVRTVKALKQQGDVNDISRIKPYDPDQTPGVKMQKIDDGNRAAIASKMKGASASEDDGDVKLIGYQRKQQRQAARNGGQVSYSYQYTPAVSANVGSFSAGAPRWVVRGRQDYTQTFGSSGMTCVNGQCYPNQPQSQSYSGMYGATPFAGQQVTSMICPGCGAPIQSACGNCGRPLRFNYDDGTVQSRPPATSRDVVPKDSEFKSEPPKATTSSLRSKPEDIPGWTTKYDDTTGRWYYEKLKVMGDDTRSWRASA